MIRRRAAIVLLPPLLGALARARRAGIEVLATVAAFEMATRDVLAEVLVEDARDAREEDKWQ